MKILKSFFILFLITSISLYSQIYSWKTETKDIVSHLSCDKMCNADLRYSFITDDNKLVLVGYIEADGYYGFDVKSSAYPYIRVFNTSTGQSEKEKLFGMPHKVKFRNTDTVDITAQYPIKTIKVGKEYWFISASLFINMEVGPVPYLVKMDEDFKIIEKVDITNIDNADFKAPMSLLTYHNGIFYDENKKRFICFAPNTKSLLVKQFDTTLNIIDQREEEFDIPPIYKNFLSYNVVAEKLDNGNYVVWFNTVFRSSSNARNYYNLNSHRLYDSDLNLIKERNRIRDDEAGYRDSGIVKIPNKIIKNPNTGGYFIYAYSNTGLLVEEYTSTGDSVRTIYFDASDVFPECNITDQVLYRDGKFTFIGLKEETENHLADNTYYTVYLIETDEAGNVTWQYKVPNITYLGARPEVILGENANTYYISGVNRNPGVYDRYELGYFNFKVMKINYYGSISDNQSSDIIVAPNPIASTFTFDYTLQTSGPLTITITDLLGEQITEEYNSYAEAGIFTKTINIEKLLPGTYYLNILHDGKITVKKIVKI
ncbi:MAG: T9SS type A sorting domain-containing protein [Bacteroidetes bacterium]|nr:T9SS type A sorting domain-containing protein [Bacteroidota bacterium]